MHLRPLLCYGLLASLTACISCPSLEAAAPNAADSTAIGTASANRPPRLYSDPAPALAYAKKRVQSADPSIQLAIHRLRSQADSLLEQRPLSVLDKKKLAASGDPHDFFSMGPYWWPNPDTGDGLPYVRRDGERNPETVGLDGSNMMATARAVYTLALAYYLTGDERYASHAAERLRVWFLDPATAMNPHLDYAQAIPGITDGRGIGIIDTMGLIEIVDAIGLLDGSPAWTAQLDAGMKAWMERYLRWLLTSKNGTDEKRQHNNHGTFYDAQVCALSLFTGQNELAKSVASEALKSRLQTQVTAEGDQPHEMSRTLSMQYSAMNARGMMTLAAHSAAAGGVDWWQNESPEGISIRKLFHFLSPYVDESTPWPKKDIREDNVARRFLFRELITKGAAHSNDPEFAEIVRQLAKRNEFSHELWHFFLPAPECETGR